MNTNLFVVRTGEACWNQINEVERRRKWKHGDEMGRTEKLKAGFYLIKERTMKLKERISSSKGTSHNCYGTNDEASRRTWNWNRKIWNQRKEDKSKFTESKMKINRKRRKWWNGRYKVYLLLLLLMSDTLLFSCWTMEFHKPSSQQYLLSKQNSFLTLTKLKF